MKKITGVLSLVILALMLTVGYASAIQYGFYNITNNNAADAAIGEAQLFMDVTDYGGGQVLFTFNNIGPAASSITDIYFDDDVPLLSFSNFVYFTGGVSYTMNATPTNLPGGNDPLYHFSSNYDYDSSTPVQPNGINPAESLGLIFNYTDSYTINDVLASLADTSFRVGLHVQGFASGGSESFIDNPPTPPAVPEPGSMLLLGTGLLGLAIFGKRRMNREF